MGGRYQRKEVQQKPEADSFEWSVTLYAIHETGSYISVQEENTTRTKQKSTENNRIQEEQTKSK